MPSSARISEVSDPDGGSTARESSFDFAAIPVMLGPLGKSEWYTDLPRFDYHLRTYSHRSVDKMTLQNQQIMGTQRYNYFQNRLDSFVDNGEPRLDGPDYTTGSKNFNPAFGRQFNRADVSQNSQMASPVKTEHGIIPVSRGAEVPDERTELYENFNIHHHDLSLGESDQDDDILQS